MGKHEIYLSVLTYKQVLIIIVPMISKVVCLVSAHQKTEPLSTSPCG